MRWFGRTFPNKGRIFSSEEEDSTRPAHEGQAFCRTRLDAILAEKRSKGALLKIHIRNFAFFNAAFGYACGDLFLQEVQALLSAIPGAEVLKESGVEFLVVLNKYAYAQAQEEAHDICSRFESAWRVGTTDYMCVMSVGMVFYMGSAQTAKDLMGFLDDAVRESAQGPPNRLVIYSSELEKKLGRRRGIAQLLERVVPSGGIHVRYRPTFHVPSGTFTRAECALRICSKEYGVVNAAEFLPIAQDSGQICMVNRYVIRAVCGEIRQLLDRGVSFESLAVALSPIQLLQESFPEEIRRVLEEYEIPPKKLAFEMGENGWVGPLGKIHTVMQTLSDMGIEWILPAFGTGTTDISRVFSLPVDVLKLERRFIWQLESNPQSVYLIEGLIGMAHNMQRKLIAEGVETQNQVDKLGAFGCAYQQGFFYSESLEPQQLEGMLGKARASV